MKTSHLFKVSCLFSSFFATNCLDVNLLDEIVENTSLDGGQIEDTSGDEPTNTDSDDQQSPQFLPPICEATEVVDLHFCKSTGPSSVSIRFFVDEPSVVSVVSPTPLTVGVLSPPWEKNHHLVVAGLGTLSPTSIEIELKDINENAIRVDTSIKATGGQAIVITEVLADPLGPEPTQEFIEIANLGHEVVDLSGWMIDDNGDINGDILPKGSLLPPGQTAIMVATDYDPNEGSDPYPDPKTLLIKLDSSICSNGLKNSTAESIELYDTGGLLVSRFPGGPVPPSAGQSTIRITAEAPDGDPLAFLPNPTFSSTPGKIPLIP